MNKHSEDNCLRPCSRTNVDLETTVDLVEKNILSPVKPCSFGRPQVNGESESASISKICSLSSRTVDWILRTVRLLRYPVSHNIIINTDLLLNYLPRSEILSNCPVRHPSDSTYIISRMVSTIYDLHQELPLPPPFHSSGLHARSGYPLSPSPHLTLAKLIDWFTYIGINTPNRKSKQSQQVRLWPSDCRHHVWALEHSHHRTLKYERKETRFPVANRVERTPTWIALRIYRYRILLVRW